MLRGEYSYIPRKAKQLYFNLPTGKSMGAPSAREEWSRKKCKIRNEKVAFHPWIRSVPLWMPLF